MDPLLEKVLQLGLGGVALLMLYLVNRDILARFSAEMKAERERNDKNLERLFDKFESLPRCRYEP